MKVFSTGPALALAAFAVVSAAGQQGTFRGGKDAVRVFVTVTDRAGRLVTTLGRGDFEVRDQNQPQPITDFDNSPQPVRLIVMLDVSGSMEGNLPLLRDAASQLFERLRPDDLARLGSFGKEVAISPAFTHDRGELEAAIPTAIDPEAPTPLWRAVDTAIGTFDKGDDTRKVVLVLTDGKDSGQTSFRERPSSQADVIDRARKEDVMIYAVGMRSRMRPSRQPGLGQAMGQPGGMRMMMLADLPDPGLARVAEETGGGYVEIKAGEDLAAAFTNVADELHTQYLLAFAPPRRDGKVHEVGVRVNQAGMKARARKSYVAPRD